MIARVHTPDAMHELGRVIGAALRAADVLVLDGPLGAGKTTLTRGIGEGLGVRGPVSSPTFVLARTHPSLSGGTPLVHVDAYRLESADQLDDLDLDFAASAVVIEWGRSIVEPLVDGGVLLELVRPTGADDSRDPAEGGGEDASDPSLGEPIEPRALHLSAFGGAAGENLLDRLERAIARATDEPDGPGHPSNPEAPGAS